MPGVVELSRANATMLNHIYSGTGLTLMCSAANFTRLSEMYMHFESSTGDIVATGCSGNTAIVRGNYSYYGISILQNSDCTLLFNLSGFSFESSLPNANRILNGNFTCVGTETDVGVLEVRSQSTFDPTIIRGKFSYKVFLIFFHRVWESRTYVFMMRPHKWKNSNNIFWT